MTMKFSAKSVALAAGASFAISLAASPVAMADSNPFGMTKLSTNSSMQLASGKCGEGKCGGGMAKDSDKKVEGKCGGNKDMSEGKCGGDKKNMSEGKCGGDKKDMSEGKCGGS